MSYSVKLNVPLEYLKPRLTSNVLIILSIKRVSSVAAEMGSVFTAVNRSAANKNTACRHEAHVRVSVCK